MQTGLSATDRKLLIGAAAIAIATAAITILFAPAGHAGESRVPSTYSSASGGARAAYLLLIDLHYRVQRWEEPPSRLPRPNQAVLILAEPAQIPSNRERQALRDFVSHGGRILFCGSIIKSFFPEAPEMKRLPGEKWIEVSRQTRSPFTRAAATITMEPQASWPKLNSAQLALYSGHRGPVVVLWRIGKGEVLWWAAATPLSNAGIRETDNLNLFLNAISPPMSAAGWNIYWDEYFHGYQSSLWSYVSATPVKWALVQIVLIAAAVVFSRSRRWGPVAAPPPASRLSPLEFVDTLGGLYEHAGATSVPVEAAYRHLRLVLARRLALPSTIEDGKLARIAAERLGWDGGRLAAVLEKAAAAQSQRLRPREAFSLVREISSYALRTESSHRASSENDWN